MNFPDMTVNGILIKQETQVAALRLFLKNESRQARSLETFLEDLGVPVYHGYTPRLEKPVAMRAADRLIQKARKAGIIRFFAGRWINDRAADAFLRGSST